MFKKANIKVGVKLACLASFRVFKVFILVRSKKKKNLLYVIIFPQALIQRGAATGGCPSELNAPSFFFF